MLARRIAFGLGQCVHRVTLKSLRERGLIDLKEDDSDNRVKYVVPTRATQAYFAKLGQALDKAARKTAG